MRKVIAFSLWGDKPIYNMGFLHNYGLKRKFYKDWEIILYHDESIDQIVKDFIVSNNIESYDMTGSKIPGEFWRFLSNDLKDVEYSIFRDCDSRIGLREELAVKEWIESGSILHVMRDHPAHRIPLGVNGMGMLAGMWGIKSGNINMTERLDQFVNENKLIWGSDQTFIYEIYKEFQDSITLHDPFFSNKPFPIKRDNKHFIGERIDENNNRVGQDYMMLK